MVDAQKGKQACAAWIDHLHAVNRFKLMPASSPEASEVVMG